ncbi:MAG: hypothetical protein LBN27_08375 [Prevotellaceae bacterium]|jgi:hypothetical protein|nr:hypothetical protein [Prevotellaceae bacterium]
MKKIFLHLSMLLSATMFFVACNEDNDPISESETLSLSTLSIGVPIAGGEYSVGLETIASWTATVSENWLTISPSSGTGNGTIIINVAENTNTAQRTATITVSANGKELLITITQASKASVEGTMTLMSEKAEITFWLTSLTATVDWGDGTNNTYAGDTVICTHTYATAETHTVTINGTDMTELEMYYNYLTSLDVTHNSALQKLTCVGNNFTELDVSYNENLIYLYCAWNKLTSLDVKRNTALIELKCEFNDITNLNVSKNKALKRLEFRNDDLESIDLSQNTALEYLDCSDNPRMLTIDLSHNTNLRYLGAYISSFTSLDLSHNTALEVLSCSGTNDTGGKLTSLDLSHNTALQALICEQNQLETLDLTNNTALRRISCRFNRLTNITVTSSHTDLAQMSIGFNQLNTEAINAIFTALPQAPAEYMPPAILEKDRVASNDVYIHTGGNPGATTCDKTIAEAKGWTVY